MPPFGSGIGFREHLEGDKPMRIETILTGRTGLAPMALAVAVLVAACGDDVTGPGETGAAEAYVQDRPSGAQGAAFALGPSFGNHQQPVTQYSGTLDAQAQVAISADGETWVALGSPSQVSVQFQAAGNGADVHGEVQVPVGTYAYVRLTLGGAQATVNAGSTIAGVSLTADVTMTLGANGSVTIEKEVPPFEVSAEARTRIFWDMNSRVWVNEQNAAEEQVEEEEVEEAAEPRTESESEEEIT
jgi:hypothetical protein